MKKTNKAHHKHDQAPSVNLTFWQTVQLGFYGVPDFKKGLVYIVAGLVIVAVTSLMRLDRTVNFISIIGGFISFMGFDQISKIIAGIRTATLDDYNKVVVQREMGKLNQRKRIPPSDQ